MKFIYLIQSIETGFYKIGISKNPNKRIESLQTGNSSELKLITSYQTEFASQIEKTLHRKYLPCQKVGEWFDLELLNEVHFIDDCKKIEQNLLFLKKNNNVFI